MELKEFLSDLNGIDPETKQPKSAITVQLQMINSITEKSSIIESFSTQVPVIDVKRRGEYLELNLIFDTDKNIHLRHFWNMYEHYGRLMNNIDENTKNIPNIFAMVVPVKDNGHKFLYAYKPIFWVPKPKAPGLESNILSIIFGLNDVDFVNNFEFDEEKAIAEAEREAIQESELRDQ